MKTKILLSSLFFSAIFGLNAQVTIYDTTHTSLNGTEITGTLNGPATSYGDAIKLAGTERFLNSITVDLFSQVDATPFTVTMRLYSDCPSVVGAGVCGSGVGTLIFGSEVTVNVTPPAAVGTLFNVEFPYSDLDISDQLDNTITVMINASRNDVFWRINETPVIGSLPDGDTALSALTRCGSVGTNNGCNRAFASPTNNNLAIKIVASPNLKTNEFLASDFSVYPNPIDDVITISNTKNILVSKISITDLNGRIIKNQSFDTVAAIEMNVSDLASGMYMMTIVSNEGTATKKIAKN